MLCNPYHNWFHVVDVLQVIPRHPRSQSKNPPNSRGADHVLPRDEERAPSGHDQNRAALPPHRRPLSRPSAPGRSPARNWPAGPPPDPAALLRHQGVTSTFLLKSRSALAALYDMDPACLEKFHRSGAPAPWLSRRPGQPIRPSRTGSSSPSRH